MNGRPAERAYWTWGWIIALILLVGAVIWTIARRDPTNLSDTSSVDVPSDPDVGRDEDIEPAH